MCDWPKKVYSMGAIFNDLERTNQHANEMDWHYEVKNRSGVEVSIRSSPRALGSLTCFD